MKNKEEIESIKKEIKALEDRMAILEKMPDREDAKKRLWDIFASCRPRKEEDMDSIFYDRGEYTYFEADFENGIFWVSWHLVWLVFEKEYGYNYDETKELCEDLVENTLKWNGLTPWPYARCLCTLAENTLKWKGLTPNISLACNCG